VGVNRDASGGVSRQSGVFVSDRSVRSLSHLQENASTARTLNLVAVWKKHADDEDYRQAPFFHSPVLNRSIIVKHRLRRHEREALYDGRSSATKVILPIDPTDLRMGARSFFIGQRGYEHMLEELSVGIGEPDSHDDQLLKIVDELPSLDPFLMRERLKKDGFSPARCYFDLTDADSTRMFHFVRKEVMPLIGISFDDMDARMNEKTAKLASKILANASDAELEPLRQGMGMAKPEFEEGVFCWKGFIYYKWTLTDLLPKVRPVSAEIASIKPTGPITDEERTYIVASRASLSKAVARACETVRVTLKVYDDAYADLTRNGQPQSFKNFLLKAPSLFYELGERLGAVHHIVSFWRYRFPAGKRPSIGGEELVDLLADFEASLSFDLEGAVAA
jgi:hypothetical protein